MNARMGNDIVTGRKRMKKWLTTSNAKYLAAMTIYSPRRYVEANY